MLVRFNSSTAGTLLMLSPTARRLLELIGKECGARGVITAEQIPAALAALRAAVAAERAAGGAPEAADAEAREGADEGPEAGAADTLALARRAPPLIRLLEWTAREDGYVLWEAPGPF